MLDDAFLKGISVVDRRSYCGLESRVNNYSCGPPAGEGGKDWSLAYKNSWYLVLLKHELCQLDPEILVV
jgi:hypothetical protein